VPRRDHGLVATRRPLRAPSTHGSGRQNCSGVGPRRSPVRGTLPILSPARFATLPPGAWCWGCGCSRRSDHLFQADISADFSGRLSRNRHASQSTKSRRSPRAPSPPHRAGAALPNRARTFPRQGAAPGQIRRRRASSAFTRPETPSRSSMLGRYARPRRRPPGLGCQRERIAALADAPCLCLPGRRGRRKKQPKHRVPNAADVGSELTRPTAWTRLGSAGSTNAHANRSQPIANIRNRSSGHSRHCRGEANSKRAGRPERRQPRGRD